MAIINNKSHFCRQAISGIPILTIMETNVQHFGQSANIPAGIFSGTEIFAHRGELYAIYNGVRILFQDLPSMEKRNFVEMYMKDKEGQEFIRKQFGITGFESGSGSGFSANSEPLTEIRTASMIRSIRIPTILPASEPIVLVVEKYAAAISH